MLVVNTEFQDHSAYKNEWSENTFLEKKCTWFIIGQNENVKIILRIINAQGSRTPSLLIILTLYLGCVLENENYTHPRSIQDAYAMFTIPCGWERNRNLNWLAMWNNLAGGGVLQVGQKWGTQSPRVNVLAGWWMPGRACMCRGQVVSFMSIHKWLFSMSNKKLFHFGQVRVDLILTLERGTHEDFWALVHQSALLS